MMIASSFLYCAILRSRANSLRSHVILHEWLACVLLLLLLLLLLSFSFYSAFLNIRRSGVLTALAWVNPLSSRHVLRTPCNHAPCSFMQNHIRKVHAYLPVTCHLRFWQNDRGLLLATAVTRGGGTDTENKSRHRQRWHGWCHTNLLPSRRVPCTPYNHAPCASEPEIYGGRPVFTQPLRAQ